MGLCCSCSTTLVKVTARRGVCCSPVLGRLIKLTRRVCARVRPGTGGLNSGVIFFNVTKKCQNPVFCTIFNLTSFWLCLFVSTFSSIYFSAHHLLRAVPRLKGLDPKGRCKNSARHVGEGVRPAQRGCCLSPVWGMWFLTRLCRSFFLLQ